MFIHACMRKEPCWEALLPRTFLRTVKLGPSWAEPQGAISGAKEQYVGMVRVALAHEGRPSSQQEWKTWEGPMLWNKSKQMGSMAKVAWRNEDWEEVRQHRNTLDTSVVLLLGQCVAIEAG